MSINPESVFLDTVGLIALWDRRDQWHDVATRKIHEIWTEGAATVTTNYVLMECGNAAARRPYRNLVVELKGELERRGLLIEPTDEDWTSAWECYERGFQHSAGIVDEVSFAVMRRLGLRRVFGNDDHFRAAGFETTF